MKPCSTYRSRASGTSHTRWVQIDRGRGTVYEYVEWGYTTRPALRSLAALCVVPDSTAVLHSTRTHATRQSPGARQAGSGDAGRDGAPLTPRRQIGCSRLLIPGVTGTRTFVAPGPSDPVLGVYHPAEQRR